MANYTVEIEIDGSQMEQLMRRDLQLCFAVGVAESTNGEPRYNVIAYTSRLMSTRVQIRWEERYAIAASNDRFFNGGNLRVATNQTEIAFGSTYVLPASFHGGSVNADAAAPKNGFLFKNEADQAAAVVYKRINGSQQPIYMSQNAPLGRGVETLVPKLEVALWFSSRAQTGGMISGFDSESLKLNMANNQSHRAQVKYNGRWTIVSN